MKLFVAAALFVAANVAAAAQTVQPYAGLHQRAIKALPDDRIGDLRAGRGIGYALAAELNGYPGPAHVLELADKLELSDTQRERVRALWTQMREEAVPLGEALINREQALDRLFATRTISENSLAASVRAVAAADGELRMTHLKYHLSMLDVMTPEQVARYNTLRGYGASAGQSQHPHHPGRH